MSTLLPGILLVSAAVVLGRSGMAHARAPRSFDAALGDQHLWDDRARRAIVVLLPPVELATALMSGARAADRGSASLTSAALIVTGSAFAVVLVIMLARSPLATCGCGARAEPVGPASLLRPLLLILAGVAATSPAGAPGSLTEQVLVVLAGVTTALVVDLVVATAVAPRPLVRP